MRDHVDVCDGDGWGTAAGDTGQWPAVWIMSGGPAPPGASGKRVDYLSWTDYFIAVAALAAQRSKDPVAQCGACIVNDSNKIVGIGYNGLPFGCDDDDFPWEKRADDPS